MEEGLAEFFKWIAYAGLAVGLLGTVIPLIPGPILIWLSALLWALADNFEAVGWPTLLVMALLGLVAEASDLIFALVGAKKGGASWKSFLAAGAGAIIGFLIFNLIGAIIGAALGMLAWETYRQGGDWRKAWRASGGLIIGYLVSAVITVTLAIFMIAIFIWQAFYGGRIV